MLGYNKMVKKCTRPTLLLFYAMLLIAILYAFVNFMSVDLTAKNVSKSTIWITKQRHEWSLVSNVKHFTHSLATSTI
jgi:hypothetical protein